MTTEERLAKLETELDRLKGHATEEGVIQGRQFILKDENRKTRAALQMTPDGPALCLCDENDEPRAVLGASQAAAPDGTRITYPESTLLLLGPDGKVTWKAP